MRLLSDLASLGYEIELTGNNIKLHYKGNEKPDEEKVAPLVKELKANKDEAIKELNQARAQINSPAPFTYSTRISANNDRQHPVNERHPLTYPVLPEAIAKVDAIRDKAMSLGWTENGLYQKQGKFRFPCGQDYGLVCYLEKDESIGAVTMQYIDIIRPSGVRQRFYNRDVDQPWIKKMH